MNTEGMTPVSQVFDESVKPARSAPPDRGGVGQEMDRLARQVDDIETVVGLLYGRLEPVMRDSVAVAKDYDMDVGGSELSRWIGANNMRLEILLDRLQHMADRIDL